PFASLLTRTTSGVCASICVVSASMLSARAGRTAMPPLRSMLISCSASSTESSTSSSLTTWSCLAISPCCAGISWYAGRKELLLDSGGHFQTNGREASVNGGSERHFRRLAGDFPHQPRHQVARQRAAQRFGDGARAGVGHFEMGRAGGAVELVQV